MSKWNWSKWKWSHHQCCSDDCPFSCMHPFYMILELHLWWVDVPVFPSRTVLTSSPCWVSRRSCCCSFSSVPIAVLQPQIWGTWRRPRAGLPISSGLGSSPGGLECPWWTPTSGCHGALQRQRTFNQMFYVCVCVHMQAKSELNAKVMQNSLAV